MRYLIMLHTEPGRTDYGVTVPDLPCVTSAGDTLHEAIDNAREAILLYLEVLAEDDHEIPAPSGRIPDDLEAGQVLALVDVDLAKMEPTRKAQRLNVTIPGYAVDLIDQAARRAGTSRSGYLTQAALAAIEQRIKLA